jgi:hypothetical protein
MIRECARLGSAVPIFCTLTYGLEWPQNPSQWKSDLDVWWKRVKRYQPDLGALWRLEPQERGAPHYHLLIYSKTGKQPFLPYQWIAENWADVTNGNPEACSRVESLRSHRGAMFYTAKYCAKLGDGSLPDGWEKVGKHWGKLSVDCLPYPPQFEMILHSPLEQKAVLTVMENAFRESFLRAVMKDLNGEDLDDSDKRWIAEDRWEKARKENDFFGKTHACFGSAEKFIEKMSAHVREYEFQLAVAAGISVQQMRAELDKRYSAA